MADGISEDHIVIPFPRRRPGAAAQVAEVAPAAAFGVALVGLGIVTAAVAGALVCAAVWDFWMGAHDDSR